MAKYEKHFKGNFNEVLSLCQDAVMDGSASATLEDRSDFLQNDVYVAVRVFERFSVMGSSRVSLSFTLVGYHDDLFLSAISSGGSQAMFFKINTFGEEAFLDTLIPAVERYIRG